MKNYLKLIACSVLMLSIAACEEEKKSLDVPVTVKIELQNQGSAAMQNEILQLDNDMDINVSLFRLYLSNIYMTNTDGAQVKLSDVVLLDIGSGIDNSFSATIPQGNYNEFKFGLGLDAELNNSDPNSFENNDHPLSAYQTMYWDMLKYRFAKFEAKANSRGNMGSNDILVALHPGTDELYRPTSHTINMDVTENNTAEIVIKIDINDLLAGSNPFDLSAEGQSHTGTPGQIAISKKFMDNLKIATSVQTSLD